MFDDCMPEANLANCGKIYGLESLNDNFVPAYWFEDVPQGPPEATQGTRNGAAELIVRGAAVDMQQAVSWYPTPEDLSDRIMMTSCLSL